MINIKYDPRKDLKNWLRIRKRYPADFKFTIYYPFDNKLDLNENNFNRILQTISKQKINIFNSQARLIKGVWQEKEEGTIKKITEYLKTPYNKLLFKVNLTTAYLMPYDAHDHWFMLPTHKNIHEQIKCLIHELFHLYQAKRYPKLTQEEKEQQVNEFLKSLQKNLP